MKRFWLAAVLFAAQAGFAAAAPQSIGDCEKIANADAYNRCLAAFGPAAKGHKMTAEPAAAAAAAASRPEAAAPQPARGGRHYRHARSRHHAAHVASRRHHGRVRMTIERGRSRRR
jgi:hypothetical protein